MSEVGASSSGTRKRTHPPENGEPSKKVCLHVFVGALIHLFILIIIQGKKGSLSQSSMGIWHYFKKDHFDKHFAICQYDNCLSRLKLANSGTSSLYRQMRSIHLLEVLNSTEVAALKPTPPAPNIMRNYFKRKEPFEEYMSRLVVKTKIPYVQHTTPELHEIYWLKGFSCVLPKSANTVREKVLGFAKKVRGQIIVEMAEHRKTSLLSVSGDEWTSGALKRYMTVNVHSPAPKFWNLGLYPINGSANTEKCTSMLKDILANHKLDIETDIAGVTTDAASVMVKMGNCLVNDLFKFNKLINKIYYRKGSDRRTSTLLRPWDPPCRTGRNVQGECGRNDAN